MTETAKPPRLALWQGPSPEGDTVQALQTLREALHAAGSLGATTLVAPEVFLPGYNHPDIAACAQPRGGVWHRALADTCRDARCGLIVGYAERGGADLFNA